MLVTSHIGILLEAPNYILIVQTELCVSGTCSST